ncbi:MAG TPA: Hsp70 family protein [Acidocella sp.]|uniref:Hsp70 family protein n=1 Tax=Acidocella sp. TaxID=50710 RepID=UPI002B7259F3|nr:Hsp70 family protein [Acidocella sp.]HVE21962.1 Hsp70 family protein [Acidocella sp.]
MTSIVGIDFGTTNSVVSRLTPDGTVHSQRFRLGSADFDVFRTVLCFATDTRQGRSLLHHQAGPVAIEAYLDDPTDSRLIMSMKTYLAQRSFAQTRIFGRIFSLEEMIAVFLRTLLEAAGLRGADLHIVAGRPVRFAGDFADDEFGEARLRAAFAAAGCPSVDVAFEPQAAGYRFIRTLERPATVLVGDFGGGTSDFSIIRFIPGAAQPLASLAHGGVGIAGDSFDYRIIDNAVSPRLGKGGVYKIMGKELPVPVDYFNSFARWHRLSLMRTPKILRDIEEVARASDDPSPLLNLVSLIQDELGYQLYQTVSAVKAELSRVPEARLRFVHDDFTIDRTIARDEFEGWVAPELRRLGESVDTTLAQAGLTAAQIDRVFLTGGTSFVPAVRALFSQRFGAEKLSAGGEFVSVAEGLALIGGDRQTESASFCEQKEAKKL